MEINLNKKSNTEASIKVRLNKGDYQPQVEKKVLEYARKIQLKGFRPGKVPAGVIKKMYGKSILVEEINHILSHKLMDYIRDNDLKILGEPIPDRDSALAIDWDNQEDFEFDYNIGLVDEFTVDISSKQKIKKYIIDVDKKALEDTITDVRKRFGSVEEGEKAGEGDVLEVDVESKDGSIKKEEARLNLSRIDKKAVKKFVGAKKGDVISFDIEKISEDEFVKSGITGLNPEQANDLKGEFKFTVKGIEHTKIAELNQDLFDKVFGKDVVKSEEEFINKVKETISSNYNRESENFLNLTIRKHLLENTKIELPDAFLREWLKITDEKITEEDLDREYNGYAESLKWNLILNKLSSDNQIKVEHEEIHAKAKEMILEQFGGPVAAASILDKLDPIVENYLQSENGKHYSETRENLRNEKVFNVIKSSVSLSEKKVSVEEFSKIVSE